MNRKGIILLLLLISILNLQVLAPSRACASLPPILIGTDPKDTTPSSVDVAGLRFTNDGTHLTFIVGLFDSPRSGGGQRYYIYMNTIDGQGATSGPAGYVAGSDYYLVWDASGAYLWRWVAVTSSWIRTSSAVTVDYLSQVDTLILSASLSDIGYPWSSHRDMGVTVITTVGNSPKDRARDTGSWTIAYAVIPEFPGVTFPIFLGSLVLTISLLYRYKFRSVGARARRS